MRPTYGLSRFPWNSARYLPSSSKATMGSSIYERELWRRASRARQGRESGGGVDDLFLLGRLSSIRSAHRFPADGICASTPIRHTLGAGSARRAVGGPRARL